MSSAAVVIGALRVNFLPLLATFNLKSDLATKLENFNFLTCDLKYLLSSSMCLSGLEMCKYSPPDRKG